MRLAVEERVGLGADVYVVKDPGAANCILLHEALKSGLILYSDERGREMLVKAVNMCYDFFITREKLRYTETVMRDYSPF